MPKRDNCRLCGGKDVVCFLSLSSMPRAGAYLKKEDLSKPEILYPLDVYFCKTCYSVQLFDIIPNCSQKLSELSAHLGSIVLDSAALTKARFDFSQSNEESSALLNEVKLMVDSKINKQYPNLDFFKVCNT